jgi:ATP-dependent Lhr-like helicase
MSSPPAVDPLAQFHPAVAGWFRSVFSEPTRPQALGWPALASGNSSLILAPTGTGKTLAAFLSCLDKLMFTPPPGAKARCRVVYVSPLKALALDVERNLRSPLVGIARVASEMGLACHLPQVAIRTGDTPQRDRARFMRAPSDVLITTPESLYLLLTSRAREALRSVTTLIIDEIHALVPEKRGAHLALSVERLAALTEQPLQRIGLSATQHPLEEVARFLGGAAVSGERLAEPDATPAPDAAHEFESGARHGYRPVQIIDASGKKALSVRIEVPVEDMSQLGKIIDLPSGAAAQGPKRASIWESIHPRLLELVNAHTSTLIFVNARRSAERLAAALNDLAGVTVAYAHHGSLSREQRSEIEDRLKAGAIKALVATSSLELGIDMGAIDLVVQIEAPPSVASGLQRIGRAGHSIGAESEGVIFPKYRGDLLACAALTRAMLEGAVEATRYPRNPLDVLAQQIVAMVSLDAYSVDALFALVRRAAPFAELPRSLFESVLDMLAGRYASDDFAELKPRITWDRLTGMLTARQGAQRIAIANGGTIPDRGLYAVYLASVERRGARLGELDEEMVFETKPGETFVLGASTWRIEDITHDRVLVSPAPGEPGKMPFWRGEAKGRSLELGRKIGALCRELSGQTPARATAQLMAAHGLQPQAASNLLQYLSEQQAATRAIPDDRTIVIERCRDELGDWRVCVLSPLGGRVHSPWAMAATARVQDELGLQVESLWTDDGFVLRFPDSESAPDPQLLLPPPEELEGLLLRQLGQSALFAARFRENAARALLLPRRRAGQRAPLWQQRKRSADLLAVAAQYPGFPMLLETYRECLRDVFDLPALTELLRDIQARTLRVVEVDTETPSPFAAALLFGFVANYIYDGDAPLAERRAQALSIDQTQLRELLGEAELRELLDPDSLANIEAQLQLLAPNYQIKNADGLHDALLRIGDLSEPEIAARSVAPLAAADWLAALVRSRRVVAVQWGPRNGASERRYIAVEDAARYRDALGVMLPPGLPVSLLTAAADPLRDLTLRYARSHAPFTLDELASRFGLGRAVAEQQLLRLSAEGKVLDGAFRPGGTQREYAHTEVLRSIRQRSLAKLRKEIEPVESDVLGRFTCQWHGLLKPRAGLDAILDAVEKLQGLALPASVLEREILSARVFDYRSDDLDALAAAGEIMWCGVEPLGERDGRVALYLTDHFARLWSAPTVELDEREQRVVELLSTRGASFFAPIHAALGGGYPQTSVDTLWGLVWKGIVTNDTFRTLRAYLSAGITRSDRRAPQRGFRSRRESPRTAEGRWSLLSSLVARAPTPTERANAWAQQLLQRYGVVTREVAVVERIAGGFSALYDVFKALEEAGRIRRGYFVSGVSAMQFAGQGVLEQLRQLRRTPEHPEVVMLAATDPANPYGALLKWNPSSGQGRTPARAAQALVILVDGALGAYLTRGGRLLSVFAPDAEPDRTRVLAAVAAELQKLGSQPERRGLLLAEIDGAAAETHALSPHLRAVGFLPSSRGFYLPRTARSQLTAARIETRLGGAADDELSLAAAIGGGPEHAENTDHTDDTDEQAELDPTGAVAEDPDLSPSAGDEEFATKRGRSNRDDQSRPKAPNA